MLTEEFVEACSPLNIKLEFGLQTIQHTEMKAIDRPNNLKRIESAIQILLDNDITFEVSLIYGLPTQTVEAFKNTIAWCQQRGVSNIKAFPLMLLRGTKL